MVIADPENPYPPKERFDDSESQSSARAPEEDARARGRLEQMSELLRRTFYAGLGAVFTTEEGIRRMASEFHLPKDAANFLIQQAGSTKDELFRIVAKELRSFLESLNISGELQKLLTTLSFEIKTEIRFIPNDEAVGGIRPDLRKKVTVKKKETKVEPPSGEGD